MSHQIAAILAGWLDGMAWLLALETATQVLVETTEQFGPMEEPS